MSRPATMSPELREARERLKRVPVSSVSDLFSLDPDEVEEGYRDAREGFPCGENRSRAYWHGWRNAQTDMGKAEPDAFSIHLIRDMLDRGFTATTIVDAHKKKFAWLQRMGLA